jgi:hypothetical protein
VHTLQASSLADVLCQDLSEPLQPGPSVVISQGDACLHLACVQQTAMIAVGILSQQHWMHMVTLTDIGCRVEAVGIVKGAPQLLGQQGANGGFPTATDAHDDVDEGDVLM